MGLNRSKVRCRAARRNAISFAKASSIGLKSGLYSGRKRARADRFNRARISGCLWTARLFEARRRRRVVTSARALARRRWTVGWSIGPVNTAGGLTPLSRSAATTVCNLPMTAGGVIADEGLQACDRGGASRRDCARSGAGDWWPRGIRQERRTGGCRVAAATSAAVASTPLPRQEYHAAYGVQVKSALMDRIS